MDAMNFQSSLEIQRITAQEYRKRIKNAASSETWYQWEFNPWGLWTRTSMSATLVPTQLKKMQSVINWGDWKQLIKDVGYYG